MRPLLGLLSSCMVGRSLWIARPIYSTLGTFLRKKCPRLKIQLNRDLRQSLWFAITGERNLATLASNQRNYSDLWKVTSSEWKVSGGLLFGSSHRHFRVGEEFSEQQKRSFNSSLSLCSRASKAAKIGWHCICMSGELLPLVGQLLCSMRHVTLHSWRHRHLIVIYGCLADRWLIEVRDGGICWPPGMAGSWCRRLVWDIHLVIGFEILLKECLCAKTEETYFWW